MGVLTTLKIYMLFIALLYSTKRYNVTYIEKRKANVKSYKELLNKFDTISSEL